MDIVDGGGEMGGLMNIENNVDFQGKHLDRKFLISDRLRNGRISILLDRSLYVSGVPASATFTYFP